MIRRQTQALQVASCSADRAVPRQVKAERRSDQMSVRMKPSTRALIESLADAEGVPIAEIVERAIAAYAKPA